MNRFTITFLLSLTSIAFAFSANALPPELDCQSNKNNTAGTYSSCNFSAQFLARSSARTKSARVCGLEFSDKWKKIIAKTAKAGATCFDAPAKSKNFEGYLRKRINSIAVLLGKGTSSANLDQQRCRRSKSLAAGKYSICRFKAEAALARNADSSKFDLEIARCERVFTRRWQSIITVTKKAGAECLDNKTAVSEYVTLIDAYSIKVAAVLAGRDQLEDVVISLSGSPLTLVAGGPSKTITVINSSNKATLRNIKANFTGTALEGKVVESANTCALLLPNATCSLSFNAGNVPLPPTNFNIEGDGAVTVVAAIAIETITPAATVAPTATIDFTPTATATATSTATATPTVTPTVTFTPTQVPVILSVSGSPLQLEANGPSGALTITNTSTTATALNITSDFTGTALDGNVTETGNTCSSVPPLASCTLSYTPGSTLVSSTSFVISGSNTASQSASIEIVGPTLSSLSPTSGSSSGGTGVTLTGTMLTGATSVTIGGVSATSLNVVNSTTVTLVTPAHASGTVDVVITTSSGSATLTNGYTYTTTAIGQSTGGGTIACLNGGSNNLIAATADNSVGVEWGGFGTAIGAGAQSTTNGDSNTSSIVTALGNNGGTPYAAQLCNNYEVDSQGNSPCEAGNTCYNDWFLPAGNNTGSSGQLNCLYVNQVAIGGFSSSFYFSSTEFSSSPTAFAWVQQFANGSQVTSNKATSLNVRCVRSFTP